MGCHLGILLAAGQSTLLTRLSPAALLRVGMALVVLLLLGMLLVLVVRIGARIARRYADKGRTSYVKSAPPDEDDWSRKPLVP
jgi:hypothetical protein